MKKILIATEKPFAKLAVEGIKSIIKASGNEFVVLENYTDKSQLIEAIKTVDAVIVRSDIISADIIEKADNLKIIVRAGAGYDNVDLKAASEKSIVVMNTPGQNSQAVAELVFAMMLNIVRNNFNGKSGTELKEKSIGMHGFGYVAKAVSQIAKGFGMKIFAFDPFVSKNEIEKEGVKALESLEELYSTCNYISLHIPANEKTKKIINYNLLTKMPQNATIINTARKEIICEESLLKIFAERTDFKYLSDVMPDCKDEIINKYPNRYIFTAKKMGAQTEEANINAGYAAANQIISFFKTGDRTFQVF